MGASQRTSLSLLIGLGAAGCMPHGGGAPSANAEPIIAKPAVNQPDVPLVAPDDPSHQAVVESVNDNVTRVSRIIRQREEAQQFADDLKEQREATALRGAEAAPDRQSDAGNGSGDESAAAIEALAARLRAEASKPVESPAQRVDPPAQRVESPAQSVEPSRQRVDPSARTVQPTLRTVDPSAQAVEPASAPPDAWANTGLSAAEPVENGDFGDAIPARRVQGSVSAPPTEVQRVVTGESAPRVIRSPGIDPLLALQEQFLSRVNEQPKNLAAQLELQLARMLRNEPVPAMADLSTLAGEDRELLAAVSDALANFRNLVRNDPNPLGSEKARPFIEMADRIRARSDLSVQSVNLCTSVKAFGNYDPIEPMQFIAGNPTWSVFYCEVDGFLSQMNEMKFWESKLSLELRLYNEAGMQLWRAAPETVVDSTRKRRRDFFIAKRIQLPSKLTPGAYMLKATIRDLQANRVAESTLQVSIVGK